MVLGPDGACPISILLPFTDRGKPSKERSVQTAVTHMASALMAMEDFNDRNPTIVPQLADDEFAIEKCSAYFPLPWDDNGENGNASTKMASVVKDDGDRQDMTAKALLSVLYDMRDDDDGHHLCAVAGSLSNLPARTASTLAAASSIPYLSHGADTTKISRPPLYPLSGKTTADEYARGDALLSYLASLDRNHVTLVYSDTNEDVLKVTSKAAGQGPQRRAAVRTRQSSVGRDRGQLSVRRHAAHPGQWIQNHRAEHNPNEPLGAQCPRGRAVGRQRR